MNPVATTDQRDLEGRALELFARPELERARGVASQLWRQVMAHPAGEQLALFDDAMEEYAFHWVLRAVNGDASHPKVLRLMQPGARWFGRDVPGSRWGGDCPDFTYRIIPVSGDSRYELRVRPTCDRPPTVTYALMANAPTATMSGTVDGRDVPAESDGSYVITAGGEPADGRLSHLEVPPGDHYVMVRDAIGDWLEVTPNAIEVERLDPPAREPLSDDEIAARAAQLVADGVFFAYWTARSGFGAPPNTVRQPRSSGAMGGLAMQAGSSGNLRLAADEALVLTANGAGAAYRSFALLDVYYRSLEYWRRPTSLNMDQMAPDDDGGFTMVVAHEDPGVHNWLDTCGWEVLQWGHRWQAFPPEGPTETPALECRVVRFDDLDAALSPGVPRLTAAERGEQLARRAAGFASRFAET